GALTPAQYEKAQAAAGNAKISLARAVREGVKIAFGTDTGVSKHGDNAQEFALMVEAGMSPDAAIRAATVGAANLLERSDRIGPIPARKAGEHNAPVGPPNLLERSDRIGTIAAGKDADIIAVDGDPLANVRLLESVGFVMKHGHVYKLGGKPQIGD